ncbi:hypothetical protein FTX61_14500 [Nitriliruptoraceae bacterium ZYF776]|nr:hypothetical protein [Profundirhabdus halotolerans]
MSTIEPLSVHRTTEGTVAYRRGAEGRLEVWREGPDPSLLGAGPRPPTPVGQARGRVASGAPVVLLVTGGVPDQRALVVALDRAVDRGVALHVVVGQPGPFGAFPHVPTDAERARELDAAQQRLTTALATARRRSTAGGSTTVVARVVPAGALVATAAAGPRDADVLVAPARRGGRARRAARRLQRRLTSTVPGTTLLS